MGRGDEHTIATIIALLLIQAYPPFRRHQGGRGDAEDDLRKNRQGP